MMRRTSVMIEVEDTVYSGLVEPHKKNKTFAKLISSLLNGYLQDGYIRAYVDDDFEEVRRAVVGSFADSVDEMESTLANMGLFSDELGARSQAGYHKFQQRRFQQEEELEKGPNIQNKSVETPSSNQKEIDALHQKVNTLEQTIQGIGRDVNDGFNQILKLLNSTVPQTVEVPKASHIQGVAESVISSKIVGISAPELSSPSVKKEVHELVGVGGRSHNADRSLQPAMGTKAGFSENADDYEEESDSDSGVAMDFLSGLMSDFSANF